VLLCETRFKADWELPGGIVEPLSHRDSGPPGSARGLGSTGPSGRCAVADWMPPYLGWEDAMS
jgi:hypothetical protein